MIKSLIKLTFLLTASFIFCLTTVTGTFSSVSSLTTEVEENNGILPLADDDIVFDKGKES